MECHRCPHRKNVESGKYRTVPFEKTPCASCELVENSDYTIRFDEERAEKSAADACGLAQMIQGANEDWLPVSVMSEAVAQLLALPRGVRDVVCWRFAGMAYRDIAAVQGLTMAAVENRHWRAMNKWPALRALFALKTAKQMQRKKPKVSGVRRKATRKQ